MEVFWPMVRTQHLLLAALVVAALNPTTAQAQQQGAITGPAKGVICDQAGPTCYDRMGPSIGLTQTYYGSIAANRLTAELRNRPTTNDFRLSNGSVCDLRAAACWSDGWQKTQLAQQLTLQLFGALPSDNRPGAEGLSGLQTPKPGVVCDPGGQLCYDQVGVSLGLTREYFGSYAEQSALRNLGGQAPPKQFRLSNGSACDAMARTCWSDGWNRQRLNVALSNQLFGNGGGGGGAGGGAGGGGSTTRLATCSITRWFKTLYRGSCELRENRSSRGRHLQVLLQDGNAYSIDRQRGGSYQITDPKGAVYPLQVRDQGRSISFSWADRLLSVTPQNAPASGLSLGQLIDSLLGY
jgi:hypothetical protein